VRDGEEGPGGGWVGGAAAEEMGATGRGRTVRGVLRGQVVSAPVSWGWRGAFRHRVRRAVGAWRLAVLKRLLVAVIPQGLGGPGWNIESNALGRFGLDMAMGDEGPTPG
jgi:hypothetical protein